MAPRARTHSQLGRPIDDGPAICSMDPNRRPRAHTRMARHHELWVLFRCMNSGLKSIDVDRSKMARTNI